MDGSSKAAAMLQLRQMLMSATQALSGEMHDTGVVGCRERGFAARLARLKQPFKIVVSQERASEEVSRCWRHSYFVAGQADVAYTLCVCASHRSQVLLAHQSCDATVTHCALFTAA